MSELNTNAIEFVHKKHNIPGPQIIATAKLLFVDACTIPFISRYRKEVTGALDEVQIKNIKEAYEEYLELEKRKVFILKAIKDLEKLTPALEKSIQACESLTILEEIYAPYKTKRKTKADKARELGLEKVSNFLLTSKDPIQNILDDLTKEFVDTKKCENIKDVISGGLDIIAETFVQDLEIKEQIRQDLKSNGEFSSEKRKDAEKIEEHHKYKDFFEYKEPIKNLFDSKNSHRFLAIRRGVAAKVLKASISSNQDYAVSLLRDKYFNESLNLGNQEVLEQTAEKAYKVSIHTSLDLEYKSELKKIADLAAIEVFGKNLKDLLLSPYLGAKAVIGIDPGIRTGCKVVVIDKTGKYIGDHVIYPFAPKFDVQGSAMIIDKILDAFEIEHIAVGNGTNGRETLQFLKQNIKRVKDKSVKATMVNESGASIYSASDIAREEFPDKDVTVRGAISIARRFQDPLAELVKIDPKSIGVGQYQHDVNQVRLKKELETITESCVNYVGVDINTASAPLLSFVSGIGPTVAKNIVKHREKNGPFKTRQDFLGISRFSEKVFEQAAGFLRIYDGEESLDSTFVHPENYQTLHSWLKSKNAQELSSEVIDQIAKDTELKEKLGPHTFKDIIDSLSAPKQDPRSEFESIDFRDDVTSMEDLKLGQWYTGVVNNLTNFGAFVDLGIKESGLLHVSEISDTFISNPAEKLKVGEKVKAKVIEIDYPRKRISLSLKNSDTVSTAQTKPSKKGKKPQAPAAPKNNAFAALKGLKLK